MCTFHEMLSAEQQTAPSTDQYISPTLSDISYKFRDENDQINTAKILSQYYDKASQFETNVLRRPKIFKPILLYHSYRCDNEEQTFGTVCENNKYNESKLSVNIQQQQQRLGISHCYMTEESDGIKKLSQETNEITHFISLEQCEDGGTDKNHDSFPDGKQSAAVSVTPNNLIQNSNSDINNIFRNDCPRSAFSKPQRSTVNDFYSSNVLVQKDNSCLEDKNTPRISENYQRNIIQTHCCRFQPYLAGLQDYSQADPSTDNQTKSSTNFESHHFLSSRQPERYLPDNYFLDWEQYMLYSNLKETYQAANCTQCLDIFNSTAYRIHLPIFGNHIVDQQFHCQYCELACTTEACLENHLKIHTAVKPHKCECGRAFARNEELTRHKRIHSGHRPFRCSLCGKTFGRKDHLNKHRTTHLHTSEKKVHVCDTEGCLQRYTRSDALARHQWATHGIRARASKWRPQH